MALLIYQVIFVSIVVLLLPFITVWIYTVPGAIDGLAQRFTIYPDKTRRRLCRVNGRVLVQAASVGEVQLIGKIPGLISPGMLITCTTASGKRLASTLYPEAVSVMMPLDLVFLHRRLRKHAAVRKVVILETELWPAMLHAYRDLDISIVNGRLSDSKYPYYLRLRKLVSRTSSVVDRVYVKDAENYTRFESLGIDKKKLKITGDLKFCYSAPRVHYADLENRHFPVIACGSTHGGEEEGLLDCYMDLKNDYPDLCMIISPRHLGRIPTIYEIAEKKGIDLCSWSKREGRSVQPGAVAILDKMGLLPSVYGISDISVIGGSFVPVGGHNLIEAAVWKVPVITGPFYQNFRETTGKFVESGGTAVAKNFKDLYNILRDLLADKSKRERMGSLNFSVYSRNRDSVLGNFKGII